MSTRKLRLRTEQIKMDPDTVTITDESESDSSNSTVFLKRSRASDAVYVLSDSDDEEEPKKKKAKLNSKKKQAEDSDDGEEPKKKKTKINSKKKQVEGKNFIDPETETIIDESESDCSNSTITLTRPRVSNALYVISDTDDEEESKKKKIKLTSKKKQSEDGEDKKKTKLSSVKSNSIKPAKNVSKSKITSKKLAKPAINYDFKWLDEDLLAEKEKVHSSICRSMIKLFEQGNTIPFIARYRRHLTGDMTPEQLRCLKESYEEIVELKCKTNTVLKSIEKCGKLSFDVKQTVLNCRNLEELELIYAPYKPAHKKSLAERAKNLGLEDAAISLMNDNKEVNIYSLVQENGPEGLRNIQEVEKNIMHILGHMIVHNSDVLAFLRELMQTVGFKIKTKITPTAKKNMKDESVVKFENYFDFEYYVNSILPHQVLAINRGESLKVLTVKVEIPTFVFNKFKYFCEQKWLKDARYQPHRIRIFNETLQEIFPKNITPFISRKVRADLKNIAHKGAIDTFAKNLKVLLLEPPIKGKVIMGIDPGLKLGCKVAMISPFGDLLDTVVINPHCGKTYNNDPEIIKQLLVKHNCGLVVIGNGKACRETETWLTNLIKLKYFEPLEVSYAIVEERGASVYSCSDEAKREFPTYDPLQISAISLARRVQDPLAELVKIDPKNLGIGMYQHDLNQKPLDNIQNEIISECVSFVGVDLNTASHCLLRRVAGLTVPRADSIIKHRQKHGPFTNRYQLKDIKGIGEKVFEQCAGFLRIMPSNSSEALKFYERPETTPLDATDIHPEAYSIVEKILEKIGLNYKQIGQPNFIEQFKLKISKIPIQELVKDFNSTEQTIKLITGALKNPLAYDLRTENPNGAIFKKNVTSYADLTCGLILTGRVSNVVPFGAFVDIGVEKNGLIHKSKMGGRQVSVGERVEVKVLRLEHGFKIALGLIQIMN